MLDQQRKPFWPVSLGFACLLALAILAPFHWRHPVLNVHALMEAQGSLTTAGSMTPIAEVTCCLPLEQQPLPVRTKFDFARLNQLCGSLQGVFHNLPDDTSGLSELSTVSPLPRVMVDSPDDRLAMAVRQHPEPQAAVPAETADEDDFSFTVIRQHPQQLIQRLEALTAQPHSADWALSTLIRVRRLTEDVSTQTADASQIVAELRELAALGKSKAIECNNEPALQQNWLQAAEGLQRRIGIWEVLASQVNSNATIPPVSGEKLLPSLNAVVQLLRDSTNGQAWYDYLLVDQLSLATSEGAGNPQAVRQKLAQEVLSRLNDARLTAEQREFVSRPPLAGLAEGLRFWAAGPVDMNTLLTLIEYYETDPQLRYAAAIAQLEERLRWSGNPKLKALADDLRKQFGQPNMRIAVSGEMLNRMIPPQQPAEAPVRETIAGHKVRGRSRTTTEVQVEVLPTHGGWRFGLHAEGKVYSQTRSETWPVKVRNAARYEYEADKVITISPQGLHADPAEAEARGRHDFLGADSQFDVPLLGAMFRDMAKNRNQKSRPLAMRQVKQKVADEARTRMDEEADPKLEQLEQKFRVHVLAPFEQLALAAEPVDMYSTADRAVMQLRLANLDQLAAHTPRPSAPADSLVSLQIHQTALNNALAGLQLEGRRLALPDLYRVLADKLGQSEITPPSDLPARAIVEFARHDAIHVSFVDDHFELVLSIRELAHGRDRIRNFQAHAFYRPTVERLGVQLVRDETLQFSGPNLRYGSRIVLHSVMGKLFAPGQRIGVLNETLVGDPRLSGLMVTQLVIDDGWIALAIGPAAPQRTAWRTPSYQLDAELVR